MEEYCYREYSYCKIKNMKYWIDSWCNQIISLASSLLGKVFQKCFTKKQNKVLRRFSCLYFRVFGLNLEIWFYRDLLHDLVAFIQVEKYKHN